ncbi:MAG: imidazolonepropionase [Ignavibacteriales bacterium]|nr:imidazolonepropionase [Ignavibacteriales bacterium]
MNTLFYNPAQILTVTTNLKNYKRGNELKEIGVLSNHSILVSDGLIKDLIPNIELDKYSFDEKIDLTKKIILPGLVECHTHLVFAGSRALEFNQRLNGKSYEQIAKSGGGINSTVKAVRQSSFEELVSLSKPRIERFIEQGVTTLEIKSGYGLSFYDEIKILEVIEQLNKLYEIEIVPTFLGAHTFPPEYNNDKDRYIDILTEELIPYISENNLAKWCDGFCEITAFSPAQIRKVFQAAKINNMEIKLHTDQFNSIGGLELALEMEAKSVDHLEIINSEKTLLFENVETVAVLLPGVSYSLKYNFAPSRHLINNNAIVALATDYNPGSSHINNISLIWGLAAFNMGMSLEEIISSYTINSAKALNLSHQIGSIEIGKNADFSIFNTTDYTDLLYNFGNNLNVKTVKKGKVIYER